MKPLARLTNQNGLTLIELIMIVAILGIVVAMSVGGLMQTVDSFNFFTSTSLTAEDIRAVFNLARRNLREIYDQTSVLAASDTLFRYINIDSDTVAFVYFGATDSLYLELNSMRGGIAGNLTAFDFNYFQENGVNAAPLLSPAQTDIWTITLTFTATNDENNIDFRTTIYPRY